MDVWHTLAPADVLQNLRADATQGLSSAEAARRLAEHGPNELIERGVKRPWRILWEQLTATMVVILMIAAIASAALGDRKDAVAILAIVVLNALLGFIQEYRAERAMAALKRLAAPTGRRWSSRRSSSPRCGSSSQCAPNATRSGVSGCARTSRSWVPSP